MHFFLPKVYLNKKIVLILTILGLFFSFILCESPFFLILFLFPFSLIAFGNEYKFFQRFVDFFIKFLYENGYITFFLQLFRILYIRLSPTLFYINLFTLNLLTIAYVLFIRYIIGLKLYNYIVPKYYFLILFLLSLGVLIRAIQNFSIFVFLYLQNNKKYKHIICTEIPEIPETNIPPEITPKVQQGGIFNRNTVNYNHYSSMSRRLNQVSNFNKGIALGTLFIGCTACYIAKLALDETSFSNSLKLVEMGEKTIEQVKKEFPHKFPPK